MKIILASSSPRRVELFSKMGLQFEQMASGEDEDMTKPIEIEELAECLSFQKANSVFAKTEEDRIVIGSDTMVYIEKTIFGKPKSRENAFEILKTLSGRWHKVISGLCVLVERNGQQSKHLTHCITNVRVKNLSDDMINTYLNTNDYQGKAGAYGIQNMFGMFVDEMQGSFFNVMGLPLHLLYDILHKENVI